jgi:hypothetical protein
MKKLFLLPLFFVLSFSISIVHWPTILPVGARTIPYKINNECNCRTGVILFPQGAGNHRHEVRLELPRLDSSAQGTVFYPEKGIHAFAVNRNVGGWESIDIKYDSRVTCLDITIYRNPTNNRAIIIWNNPPH